MEPTQSDIDAIRAEFDRARVACLNAYINVGFYADRAGYDACWAGYYDARDRYLEAQSLTEQE